MLTKKRIIGWAVACAGALAAFTFSGSQVSADEARLTVTPAVYRAVDGDEHGATIQLVRHGWGGGYRGGWGGGYRGYGWGGGYRGWGGYGYRRPFYGYGYPGIGYGVGYGYPAYGYGYPAYGYGYPAYGGGVGIGIW